MKGRRIDGEEGSGGKRRGEVVCCRRDDGAATVVAEVVWRNVEVGVRRRRGASTAGRCAEERGDRKGGKEARKK